MTGKRYSLYDWRERFSKDQQDTIAGGQRLIYESPKESFTVGDRYFVLLIGRLADILDEYDKLLRAPDSDTATLHIRIDADKIERMITDAIYEKIRKGIVDV